MGFLPVAAFVLHATNQPRGQMTPSITPTGEEIAMMFLDCPAYRDEDRATRCGLPAEVEYRYIARSTDGPLECAKIRCPRGHWFNSPIEFLTVAAPVPACRPDQTARMADDGRV